MDRTVTIRFSSILLFLCFLIKASLVSECGYCSVRADTVIHMGLTASSRDVTCISTYLALFWAQR